MRSSVVAEALKSSTAHGVSHAVATKSVPLKVMYILLFFVFCGLFVKYSVTLLQKLREEKTTRDYEFNAADFEFPDLYFCPTRPISGSFPYRLGEKEAEEVNKEVRRVGRLYDRYTNRTGIFNLTNFKQVFSMQSMSRKILTERLAMKMQQSMPVAAVEDPGRFAYTVGPSSFEHAFGVVCFKPVLTQKLLKRMQSPGNTLTIRLFTDNYFPNHVTHNPINPIQAFGSDELSPLENWNPIDFEDIKVTGFDMVIVPRNTYPSLSMETRVQLEPGHSYEMQLQMEVQTFDPSLATKRCETQVSEIAFMNPVTGGRENFSYSYAACIYDRKSELMLQRFKCLANTHPKPWKYRVQPHCMNLSEVQYDTFVYSIKNSKFWTEVENEAREVCQNRMPPKLQRYIPTYSFGKWPSSDRAVVNFLGSSEIRTRRKEWNETSTPGLVRLLSMARQLKSGNWTAHLEGHFRTLLSESLLQVRISPMYSKSTIVHLVPSYSLVQFLADAGGLLGLYIGCSLLTLFEVVELMYNLIEARSRSSATATPDGGKRRPRREAEEEGEKAELAA